MNQQANNQRYIFVGVLALVVAGAVLLVTQVFNDEDEAAEEAIDPFGRPVEAEEEEVEERPGFLFPEEQEEISAVTRFEVINNETGEVINAQAVDGEQGIFGGDWELIEANEEFDTGLGTDSNSINSAVISLPTLRPESEFDDISADELDDFGLANPAYTLTFETDLDNEYTLLIGAQNPSSTAYYIQTETESDVVYLIGTTRLDPIINFFEAPPYVQPDVIPDIDPGAVPSEGLPAE